MYRIIWIVFFLATGGRKHQPHSNAAARPNNGQSPNAVSMAGQRRIRWANIETVLGVCWGAAAKYTADPVLE